MQNGGCEILQTDHSRRLVKKVNSRDFRAGVGGGGLGFCIRRSNFGAQDFETTVLRMTGSLEPWYTPHLGTTGSLVVKRFYSVGCSIIIVSSICIITGIIMNIVFIVMIITTIIIIIITGTFISVPISTC